MCFLCVLFCFVLCLLTLVCLMATVAGGGEFISHSSCPAQLAGPNITKPYQIQLRKLGGFFAATGKLPMHDCHWSASWMRKRCWFLENGAKLNVKLAEIYDVFCIVAYWVVGICLFSCY